MTDIYSSYDTAYQLGYKRGQEDQIKIVYYDNDISTDKLEHIYTLQAENIDNLIYLPKSCVLKTFSLAQLKEVRDQFYSYVNSIIEEKLSENLEG